MSPLEAILEVPLSRIGLAAEETLYMVFVSLFLGSLIGLVLALTLVLTNEDGILGNRYVYAVVNAVVNTVRSVPFVILLVFVLPLTKFIVGTRIGTTAALVPLILFIAPYLTRLFENSLLEVDKGILEAAQSMGATWFEIIRYFCFPKRKAP